MLVAILVMVSIICLSVVFFLSAMGYSLYIDSLKTRSKYKLIKEENDLFKKQKEENN